MLPKRLIIMRGVPGSGKSTLAKSLGLIGESKFPPVILEADDFFHDASGKYHFLPQYLAVAHNWCKRRCLSFMREGKDIIVSNTNLEKWQFQPYLRMAEEFGYEVQYIIVHTPGQENIHGCPPEKVKDMERRLLDSLCTEGF